MLQLSTHVTYETGTDEPVHPDPKVEMRFIEVAMSKCFAGCKIYADPMSRVNVLAHSAVYGCTKTKAVLNRHIRELVS